ncbi:NAD(P)-binding protein [Auriculariales sp. MPI-PUGE-AT-0066]|nr:NAD(P)-binding protein [Auriculariales sp. MPI-PUGE-AT-0066]
MSHFDYKTICVVGATSGIGKALAEALVAIPSAPTVIAVGRREDRLKALADSSAAQGKIKPFVADISTSQQAEAFFSKLVKEYPSLDAIIVNAGVQYLQDWSNPESIDLDKLATETDLNYKAVLATAKGALTHFKKLNRGAFVTVTSGLAAVPKADTANYNASKAGVRSFTLSLRYAYKDSPIQIREIVPPLVESELHDNQGTSEKLAGAWVPLSDFIPHVISKLVQTDDPEITYGFSEKGYSNFEKGKWDVMLSMAGGPPKRN